MAGQITYSFSLKHGINKLKLEKIMNLLSYILLETIFSALSCIVFIKNIFFGRMKKAAGVSDIEEVVRRFETQEETATHLQELQVMIAT